MRRAGDRPPARWLVLGGIAVALAVSCEEDDEPSGAEAAAPSASARPGELPEELAARVLARVGGRTITLGEYATALDRMDRFERLRYQTADRRKKLLTEMIDLELLAREAERRGLDKRPKARMLERQILRDALLEQVRSQVPSLEELPTNAVRAYYNDHRDELRDPPRRRVAAIVLSSRARATAVLRKAQAADAGRWARLVRRHSERAEPEPTGAPDTPDGLAGDLGLVTRPDEGDSDPVSDRVPDAVRAAVFAVDEVGGVLDRVVEAGERFYVVRLVGKAPARRRSFAEAERSIRVRLLRERIREAERELETKLRRQYPVTINEDALDQVDLPDGVVEAKDDSQ